MSGQDRLHWTSASNAEADSLCPGRYWAQKGLPDLRKDQAAIDGEIIHKLWTLCTNETLPFKEGVTGQNLDKAGALVDAEIQVVCDHFGARKIEGQWPPEGLTRLVETRLWYEGGGDFMHSGQFDVSIIHLPTLRVLVLDGKTGWGDVAPNQRNQQLRDLAALWHYEIGANEVAVSILRPFGKQERPCVYVREDLITALVEMHRRVKASNNPQAKRLAGEVQCRYCRAQGICKERQEWIMAAWPGGVSPALEKSPLPVAPASQWTPAQRSLFCEREAMARQWLADRKEEIRQLLKLDPASVPGFGLKPGRFDVSITDLQKVYERFCDLGGVAAQFLKAMKGLKGELKEQVRSVTGLGGKTLDEKLKGLLDGCTEKKQSEPTIEKL